MKTSTVLVIEGIRVRVTTNARLPRVITWLRLVPRRCNDQMKRWLGRNVTPDAYRRPINTMAVTIGHHMRFAEDGGDVSATLLAHEWLHVWQRRHHGFWEYYSRYLIELVKDGYDHDHDFEREAFARAPELAHTLSRYLPLLPRRATVRTGAA